MLHRRNRANWLAAFVMLGALCAPPVALAVTTVSVEQVVITDSQIRLGDLFDGLAEKANEPIGPAPAPGERVQFDITRLAALARAHDLDWRPHTWSDRVILERASQKVDQQAIEAVLRNELQRRGFNRKSEIEFAQRMPEIALPIGVPATITVQQFDYDERSGRFTALIVSPADSPTTRLAVQGRVHEVMDIPVLARRFNAGEIVHKGDIDWITMRSDQVNRNILTDATRLIGQEVRRGTGAGQPLRGSEIRSPIIVSKGSTVTMILQTPKMQLTSKGRAMEDASIGDTVSIMNTQSKTVIEATVVGANTVQVTPAAAMRY